MTKLDLHVAAEGGDIEALKIGLSELGFVDDNLSSQQLFFDAETARYYEACPIIAVHVSRKFGDSVEQRNVEKKVDALMRSSGSIGYWHSEFVMERVRIESNRPFALKPLPFAKLRSRPRLDRKKIWDAHFRLDLDETPKELLEVLVEYGGLYYLIRWREGKKVVVPTMQGVNSRPEGKRLFDGICQWLEDVGAPPVDAKFEITTAMEIYGSPRLVPPTIETIEWL